MPTVIEKSPCKNNPLRAKGRREKNDRRQKAEKLMTQLDRRNIQDRRDIKDRRFSKQKTYLFPVMQQGITIQALNLEKDKLNKLLSYISSSVASLPYIDVVDLLKDVYFALCSQVSKETVLQQWYEDTVEYSKSDSKYTALVKQLNFILEQEMDDIIAIVDKYLQLTVDLEEAPEEFVEDMQNIQQTLTAYTCRKAKYIYPYYQEMLSLS